MVKQADISEFADQGEQFSGHETVRLKHLAEINPTKSEISHLDPKTEVSFVALEDFGTDGEIKNTEVRVLDDVYDGYTYFREGDIAIAKITPSFENGKGAICRNLKNGIGFGTTEIHVLRPREDVSKELLWYILRSKSFMDEAETAMRGVAGQKRVPTEFLENHTISTSILETQDQIVQKLDDELKIINSLLDKLDRISDLIQERSRTRIRNIILGRSSDSEYKETGLPEIGPIPKHWRLSKVKFELKNLDSRRIPLSASERSQQPDNYPYYGASGVIDSVEDYLFDGKYVLIGEDGENLRSRSKRLSFVAEGRFWPNNHVHILKPYEGDEVYFAELLESLNYEQYVEGAAQPKLTAKELGDIQIPVPPKSQQEQLRGCVTKVQQKRDDIINRISDATRVLEERRQALITGAVTGQIDMSTD